MTIAHIYRER